MCEQNRSVNKRNGSVDFFRYVFSILIVALHVTAFSDVHPMLSYLVAQTLPRIATPFFLAVAGYYHACRIKRGKGNTKEYVSRLLVTYALWSTIYIVIRLSQGQTIEIGKYIVSFVLLGTEYHFWFFPALILSVLLTTLFFRIRCEKLMIPMALVLYTAACLNHSHYVIGIKLPVISVLIESSIWEWFETMMCYGFPFFVCGYLVYRIREKWACDQYGIYALAGLCAFLGEVVFLKLLGWSRTITVTPMLYGFMVVFMLYVLENPLDIQPSKANYCRILANYTYYSHVAFIMVFTCVGKMLGFEHIPETCMFLFVVLTTAITGRMMANSNNRIIRMILG